MSEAELLELGAVRPSSSRQRLWRLLMAALVVLAGGLVIWNGVLRERVEREVAACAERVDAAVELEGRRVRATYEYVRFAAGLVDAQGQLGSLYLQIAKAARGSGGELLEARDACTSISLSPLHSDLDGRRDRCVQVLDAQRTRLVALAADGRSIAEWLDAPRSC